MRSQTIFIQGLNMKITYLIGENKADNFHVIDNSSPNDIWIHANHISSCHVVCKMPDGIKRKDIRYIIKASALLCKKYTGKLNGLVTDFVYCKMSDVRKTDVIGCVSVSNSKNIIV